jgi:endonuclease/exonuclease/phosphatase family metal-dependent hydrolase
MGGRERARDGIVVALCCLLLAASATTVLGQEPAAATVRLGSWNIEHLGSPGSRRGTGENVTQEPRDLARYIRYAGVDVLAVQEITADGAAPAGFPRKYRSNSILTRALGELNKGGAEWKHLLFPRMRPADTGQWVGIAWNARRVQPVGDIVQLPVSHARTTQNSNRWDRNLHAMMFSAGKGKTDFVLLVVHLKANASASFARHREEEIAEFLNQAGALRKAFPTEKEWVLLGDTNIQNAGESAVRALSEAGFRDLNEHDIDTHTAKGIQPFDRVFVPKNQPEFAKSRLEVLSAFQKEERLSFAEFRARYSDHYIICTSIEVKADDD